MRVYGLTGGIASGKSTVARWLRELGAIVIDADTLAREAVEPGQPALAEIAARFPGVIGLDGRLDRTRLAARIFGDPNERAALNAIIHPRVASAFVEARRQHEKLGTPVLVYDAALLIENGIHSSLDGVLLVSAPPAMQRARLMARDGLTDAQADARLAAQWPLERKLPYARWIVDNSGSEAETRAQVAQAWCEMRGS